MNRPGDREHMNDTVRPDEVIEPEGGTAVQLRALVRDVAFMLPNLVKLLTRLLRDPRVPRKTKLLLGGLVAYLASPIDVIPDAIPVVGVADDVVLAAYAVNHLIRTAGEDIVLEHWDGPRDLLDMVRSILDATTQLVPGSVRAWIDRLTR